MNSSLSFMSTYTMVSNMSLRYLKSFAINTPSKTRPKWCITWRKKNYQLLDGLLIVLVVDVHEHVDDKFFFFKKVVLQLVNCYRRLHKKFQRSSSKITTNCNIPPPEVDPPLALQDCISVNFKVFFSAGWDNRMQRVDKLNSCIIVKLGLQFI